jgi:hypothetical protein
MALVTHKVLNTGQPHYLESLMTEYKPTRQRRSEHKRQLSNPVRPFTRASEAVWNNLLEDIRIRADLEYFESKFKSSLFAAVDWM